MKTHFLKIWPQFFEPELSGQKRFEVQFNDRDFQENDLLVLQEWDPKKEAYTGREMAARVDYIFGSTRFGLLDGWVIMSITKEGEWEGVERAGGQVVPGVGDGAPAPTGPAAGQGGSREIPLATCKIQLGPPELEKPAFVQPPDPEWPAAPIKPAPQITFAEEEEKAGIMAAHQAKLKVADEVLQELAQKVAEAEVRAREHKKNLATIKALEKELEAYQAVDPAQIEIDRLERLIKELDEIIARRQQLLAKVEEYKAALEVSLKADSELPDLEDKVTLYDDMVKALAPGGIPSQMIAKALNGLNDLLDMAAAYLFPDRILKVTPELNIELEGSPYATLSKSAKFRVGVAFQYALARLAGARILMIDEADILDHVGRVELINFMMTQLGNFDQVLVFFTSDKPFFSPVADNWWLADTGVIQKVIAH